MKNYKHISTATDTVVRSAAGMLHSVVINATAAGAITLYDNASAASGDVIGIIKASATEGTYLYDIVFKNGLVVKTAGASDLTVSTSSGEF